MISTLLKSATTITGSALRCILACHVSLHAAWSFAWQVRQLSEPTNWLPLMPSIAVAGPVIAVVVDLDVELAVERHPDLLSHKLDAQRMPLVLRYRGIDVLDRVSASVLRVVQRNVVLQGIGPCDVVVVTILPPPNKTAGLVLLARDRLELHFDHTVG